MVLLTYLISLLLNNYYQKIKNYMILKVLMDLLHLNVHLILIKGIMVNPQIYGHLVSAYIHSLLAYSLFMLKVKSKSKLILKKKNHIFQLNLVKIVKI